MVKELSMVPSIVLMLTWSISSASCSKAAIILTAWPGIRGETVFNMTLAPAPENFTSTSAMADFELAASSLLT